MACREGFDIWHYARSWWGWKHSLLRLSWWKRGLGFGPYSGMIWQDSFVTYYH